MKHEYTADTAIEEISNRISTVLAVMPASQMEKSLAIIENNKAKSLAQIEKDRNYKYANFDRIVSQFGYGCSLRAIIHRAKKAGDMTDDLQTLFNN